VIDAEKASYPVVVQPSPRRPTNDDISARVPVSSVEPGLTISRVTP
jgi:hypothetical protein